MKNELDDIESDINVKVVLSILARYKYVIILSTIIVTIFAAFFAYLQPDIYKTETRIALERDKGKNNDLIEAALSGGGIENSSDDEIALLTSSMMIKKSLDKLDIGTRYFFENKLKTIEMYKQSPFVVNVLSMEDRMYGKKIFIVNIDEKHFRLEIRKPPLTFKGIKKSLFSNPKPPIIFSQEYEYGQEIITSWFKIKVQKLSDLIKKEYYFTYVPNKGMFSLIYFNMSAGFISKDSSILEIVFEDTVPLRAQEIVNAVAETYLEDQAEQKNKATLKTLKFLDGELSVLNKALSQSAGKLKTFKQTNSTAMLDKAAENTSTRMTQVEVELRQLEFERSVLENLKAYMVEGKDLANITLSNTELSNQTLIDSINKFHELNEERRKLLAAFTEFHPDVIKTVDEINIIKKKIKYIIESSLSRLEQRKVFLNKEHDDLQQSMQALPQQESNLADLTRNFAVNEKIYSFLLEKRAETEMFLSSKSQNVRVLDKASVPGKPKGPNREMMILTGAVFGFLLGASIAFMLYFRDDTIKTMEEVERIVDIPFFGLIPYLKEKKYTLAYEEAFRTLRTNLEFVKIDKSSKTILVASAISGEGKSTTIKNLAQMLVKLNRKVIVLDFDLRRPSMHKYFMGINNNTGLSLIISGQAGLQDSIQKTKDNISVISAGPIPPNPSELIMSEEAKFLLKTLSSSYDYVLIDSPPYSIVTDAAILMKASDITLFSIMAEYTNRSSVKELKKIIEKYDVKSAGIIYNGIKLNKKERHGYGYY